MDSRNIYPIEVTNNVTAVMKDELLVSNTMKYFTIHPYVQFFKTFGLGHMIACVYQFVGDETKEKFNILHFLFPGLGSCIEIKYYVAHIYNITIHFYIRMRNIFFS